MGRHWWLSVGLLLVVQAFSARGDVPWTAGIREGGGGFFLSAPDHAFHLSLLGYGQFTGNVYLDDYVDGGERADVPFGFGVRRARMDMLATLFRQWEFLLEVGSPTLPTSGTGVGVVEARVTAPIYEDAIGFRMGKFVVPFSAENAFSSRSLATVERFSLLNSLIAANFLDTQIGAMLFGRTDNRAFHYYVGAFNGNGDSQTLNGDDNGHKQIQAKFVIQPGEHISFGLGYDTSVDTGGTFSLLDHAFVPVASAVYTGRRHGLDVDIDVKVDWFTFRTEWIGYLFPESRDLPGGLRSLLGMYLHLGMFFVGNENRGFETVWRVEWSRMTAAGAVTDLFSVILGWNWYFNANVRWQMNYVGEVPTRPSGAGTYADASVKHMILNELQVKF